MYQRLLCFGLLWLFCSPVLGDNLAAANAEADSTHSNGKTALMVAAKNGDNKRVKELIEHGAEVNGANNNGGTPIMYAALSGDPETVTLLLQHGAVVNAVAENGWTALMIAAVKGYVDVVRLLLERGAAPNQADVYSWTPLMRAVYENRLAVVKLLVSHQSTNVNQRGENGVTALHMAVLKKNADSVKLLLASGADPEIEDNSGRTALDFARKNNDLNLIRIMGTGLPN